MTEIPRDCWINKYQWIFQRNLMGRRSIVAGIVIKSAQPPLLRWTIRIKVPGTGESCACPRGRIIHGSRTSALLSHVSLIQDSLCGAESSLFSGIREGAKALPGEIFPPRRLWRVYLEVRSIVLLFSRIRLAQTCLSAARALQDVPKRETHRAFEARHQIYYFKK